MNMHGTLVYSALSTPIFCCMFCVNICERLEKHSSVWKWFAAAIQDHILISFSFPQSCTMHVNRNLHMYKTVLIVQKIDLIQKYWVMLSYNFHIKFQLPDQATTILDLLAWIKFLVAPGKWAAVNVEPWFKVIYDWWCWITLWFTGHPSLTYFLHTHRTLAHDHVIILYRKLFNNYS